MNVTIKLDDNIDISFFKRMLFQIKGVQEIQIEDEGQWIKKAIDKSRIQFENEESQEMSKELLDKIFERK